MHLSVRGLDCYLLPLRDPRRAMQRGLSTVPEADQRSRLYQGPAVLHVPCLLNLRRADVPLRLPDALDHKRDL